MRIPATIADAKLKMAIEAAIAGFGDESFWYSNEAAVSLRRGHLRDRNGGEGGVMHSSCNRLPYANELFSELAEPVSVFGDSAEAQPFVRGLMWAFGLSAVFWIGLGALVLK